MNRAGDAFERAVSRAHGVVFNPSVALTALAMAYLIGHIIFAFLRGTLPIRQDLYGSELRKSVDTLAVHGTSHTPARTIPAPRQDVFALFAENRGIR